MNKIEFILGYIERYLTPFITVIFFILVLVYEKSFQFILTSSFLDKIITISAALFAFLLTILTIIVQSESDSIKVIKKHPGYRRFITFNRRIVFLFLTTTILSLVISFTQHIFKYLNASALFIIADINASICLWATLDAIYFTFLFYTLVMLDVKKD